MNSDSLSNPFFYGVINIPTIRSEFAFKQFEEKLQALAYKTALEIITNIKACKEGEFKVRKGEIYKLETDTWQFTFYAKRVSFSPTKLKKSTWSESGTYIWPLWSCTVEEKLYSDSPHSSKIHFDVDDNENLEEKRAKIMTFLDELMAGVTPVHRFSLKTVPASKPTATQENHGLLKSISESS